MLEAAELLLKLGTNINDVDVNGETAMHAAALKNLPKVIQFLADHGAKPEHGGKLHVHADGTAHQHHDDGAAPQAPADDGKGPIASCCGLFSVVAIPGEPVPSFGLDSLASVVLPVFGEALSGRGPERINRPPIT